MISLSPVTVQKAVLENQPTGIPSASSACQQSGSHSQRSRGEGCYHRAVCSRTLRNPNPSPLSKLRCNLEALFSPRFKVSARKFGELASLKLLAVSEHRGIV